MSTELSFRDSRDLHSTENDVRREGELTRRSFLRLVGGVGASFVLGSFVTTACAASSSTAKEAAETFAPSAFLRIDPDGTCTVMISKSDMGQGVRTTFAMLVAEELDADWSKVKVEQAPGDGSVYGRMGTGGSSSVRTMNRNLRMVGAAARKMLIAAAAKQWGADPSACRTESGRVLGPDGKSASYGELAGAAKAFDVPQVTEKDLKLKSDYKILGKAKNRVDNLDVVTGKAMFANDVHVDGMVHAVCLRAPAAGARLATLDDSAARKIPGVLDTLKLGDDRVAVIATNTWSALKGREALKATWQNPHENVSTESLRQELVKLVGAHAQMPTGGKVIEATFDLPYLAHAPMEPLNAVASVKGDRVEVWTGSQSPDGVRDDIVQSLGVRAENVTVHNLLLGGGFGRRSGGDFSAEAVEISHKLQEPVKLLWSRECDMQHDTYRPMSHHALKATIDADGKPAGWSHQLIQSPNWSRNDQYGNARLNYTIPGAAMRQTGIDSSVPTGAWRSVENSQINVVNEIFLDELAKAAGSDPLEFRMKYVKDERLKKVLQMAGEKSGWGTSLPKGSGRGVACFNGYGSRIAHVVELTLKGKEVQIDRVVAVVDVGTAINPRGVEAQVQGAFMDGVATALKAAITIDKGGAVQSNWDGYEWARMTDMPAKMEVYVVDSGADFGGMGEVGYPSSPAAIANAIAAATGKRIHKLPIKIEELV